MITDYTERILCDEGNMKEFTEIRAKANDVLITVEKYDNAAFTRLESKRKANKVYVLYKVIMDENDYPWDIVEGIFETKEAADEVCNFLMEHASLKDDDEYVQEYYVSEVSLL